ncbi:quinone-dependent dihydroorotate dehydrogenase [Salinibius halmophilus]|uniref:quinone-dependent dihydroorotate dehydrogenase n=1 Tax=Salinibius halmophilus TaxID=1853216 RepID=UPI000E66D71F|nr:quinone-dependent dihydroorotate dehydrogenase [Salinibius halmophilus]
MYDLARSILFKLTPETAHNVTIDLLSMAQRFKMVGMVAPKFDAQPVKVMGLTFANSVGLAAGLDKDGECIDAFGALGFGHIELGTVTPRPQPGNEQPRLFRVKSAQGIINRMGFNNKGVDHLVENVKRANYQGIIGINIGKNKDTPAEDALADYAYCMEKAWSVASYIAINLSSPNTPGLRDLQFGEPLVALMQGIKDKREALHESTGRNVPIAVKLAPDTADEDLQNIVEVLIEHGIDAIIGTNTTIERSMIDGLEHSTETGGLSGAPVFELSTEKLGVIAEAVDGRIPLIGVGGVLSGSDAIEKMKHGASLVQVYSGFIYRGPELVKECSQAIDGWKQDASVE